MKSVPASNGSAGKSAEILDAQDPVSLPWTSDHSAVLRSLEAISATMREDQDPYSTLADLCRVITEVTPWSICWAALLDPDTQHVILQHGSGFGTPFSPDAYEGWPVQGSISAQAITTGVPVVIPDVDATIDSERVQADAAIRGFRSALVLPLSTGSLSGALWLCRPTPHQFTESDYVFGAAVASHVATALRNAHELAERRQARDSRLEQLDDLSRLHQTTIEQKENLERISAIHETLMQQVLNNEGVTQLAHTAARLLEKPVVLFDRFDHILCAVGLTDGQTTEAEQTLGPRLRTEFTNRPTRASFLDMADTRYLIVPIDSEGRSLGNLCVRYGEATAGDLDVQLAEQVGLFFALELLKDRIRLDVALRLDSDLFASLLTNSAKLTQPLLEEAALRGLDLVRPSVVVRVRVSSPPEADWFDIVAWTAWLLRSKIAEFGANASAAMFPAQHCEAVVIVNGSPLPPMREQVLPTVRAALTESLKRAGAKDLKISTGVGIVGHGLEGLQASHEAALKALSVVETLGMEGADIDLSDYAAYGLLLSIPPEQQSMYVQTVLGALLEYDRSHSAEFAKTLECYLESHGSVQRTAETLFLHPTTVRYRLGRIEDLSGFKLDNSEHRLTLSLALRLHRIANNAVITTNAATDKLLARRNSQDGQT